MIEDMKIKCVMMKWVWA